MEQGQRPFIRYLFFMCGYGALLGGIYFFTQRYETQKRPEYLEKRSVSVILPKEKIQNQSSIQKKDSAPLSSLNPQNDGSEKREKSPSSPEPSSKTPWDAEAPFIQYRMPFSNPHHRPYISLTLLGVGGEKELLDQALATLPQEITLGYVPHQEESPSELWERTKQSGHEILLMVPLEPHFYPQSDPGKDTLLTGLPPQENVRRLQAHLSHRKGIIGVTHFLGARFALSPQDVTAFVKALYQEGLMFFEADLSPRSVIYDIAQAEGLPVVKSLVSIDIPLNAEAISKKLTFLEKQARQHGYAVGYGFASLLTIQTLAVWSKTLEHKGIILAPLSVLAAAQAEKKRSLQ